LKVDQIYATIENMSNSLQRKLERKKRLLKRKKAKKELAKKLKGLFLPDECSNCKAEFNKKNKDMASTWMVVANKERKHLICPECWEEIKKLTPLPENQDDQPDQHQTP
jgi:intein/homing endonuclease